MNTAAENGRTMAVLVVIALLVARGDVTALRCNLGCLTNIYAASIVVNTEIAGSGEKAQASKSQEHQIHTTYSLTGRSLRQTTTASQRHVQSVRYKEPPDIPIVIFHRVSYFPPQPTRLLRICQGHSPPDITSKKPSPPTKNPSRGSRSRAEYLP